jgi:crotonobetainyl-CoA:carnitine CoA-transferase CaiB-like acyl-CoA transferase
MDNACRGKNRKTLQVRLGAALAKWSSADLLAAMDAAQLPGGRVNSIPDVFADPQISARGLIKTLHREDGTAVKVIGFPAKFSATPADYRRAPARCGHDTAMVLREVLALDEDAIAKLAENGVVVVGGGPSS